MLQKIGGILFALSLLSIPVAADVLELHNGRTIEGTFEGGDSDWVRFRRTNGRVETYPVSEVKNIAFGQTGTTSSNAPGSTADQGLVPAGTALVVRMIDSINSDENKAGELFSATVAEPVTVNGEIVIPKDSEATVQLVRVEQAGTLRGKEEMSLQLHSLRVNGRSYAVSSEYAEVASSGKGGDSAKVVGGTTALGALIGAIGGGGKGAAIGAATGAGAGVAIQAVRGKEVKVNSEAMLSFSLKEPISVR